MKIFNTVQELWDYCLFCPICNSNTREVEAKIGPSGVFKLNFASKEGLSLRLWCTYGNKQKSYNVEYDINCADNNFEIQVTERQPTDPPLASTPVDIKNIKPFFYFWLQSNCNKCESASTHGADLELSILDKKISNIKLERESLYLVNDYHVTLFHDSNTMLVSKSSSNGVEDSKPIKLPLVTMDLTDQAKVINKIKTLILFS